MMKYREISERLFLVFSLDFNSCGFFFVKFAKNFHAILAFFFFNSFSLLSAINFFFREII